MMGSLATAKLFQSGITVFFTLSALHETPVSPRPHQHLSPWASLTQLPSGLAAVPHCAFAFHFPDG